LEYRRRKGGLIESLTGFNSSSMPLFTRQTHEEEITGSESTNHDGTGAQRSSTEVHSVARTSHVLNGSNSQKGQGHGKSQGDTHTSLGSSLYYGGPDLCCDPSTTTTEGLLGKMKIDNTEDDKSSSSMGASRGDWWQGSLYY
jgi:hypothetical protein